MLYKKGEQRERGFLTGYSKAVKLKAAMETFVNIHLRDPEFAKELSDNLPDPAQVRAPETTRDHPRPSETTRGHKRPSETF
jgi:hypothetical protein